MQDRFSHSGVDDDSCHLEYHAMPASKWLHIFKNHGAAQVHMVCFTLNVTALGSSSMSVIICRSTVWNIQKYRVGQKCLTVFKINYERKGTMCNKRK